MIYQIQQGKNRGVGVVGVDDFDLSDGRAYWCVSEWRGQGLNDTASMCLSDHSNIEIPQTLQLEK